MNPALWLPVLVLALAAVVDLRKREIPHAFPLLLLAWAVLSRLLGYQAADWASALLGAGLGLLLGALLFALDVLGGGDAKLLAGLGAVLGPLGLLLVLPPIALAGGLFALLGVVRGEREVAYAPAICLGYLAALLVL